MPADGTVVKSLKMILINWAYDTSGVLYSDTEIENYLKDFRRFGFLDVETIERIQRGATIPKSHSKFFYRIPFREKDARPGNILLDVLYEDSHYNKVERVPVSSPFIELDDNSLLVSIPSVNDILGDKFTAFAPNTSGIPYFKGDKDCTADRRRIELPYGNWHGLSKEIIR